MKSLRSSIYRVKVSLLLIHSGTRGYSANCLHLRQYIERDASQIKTGTSKVIIGTLFLSSQSARKPRSLRVEYEPSIIVVCSLASLRVASFFMCRRKCAKSQRCRRFVWKCCKPRVHTTHRFTETKCKRIICPSQIDRLKEIYMSSTLHYLLTLDQFDYKVSLSFE